MLDQTAEACHSANPARNACVQTAAKPLLAACSVLSSIFFVFIDIFITSEYDLYNKSYFGGE